MQISFLHWVVFILSQVRLIQPEKPVKAFLTSESHTSQQIKKRLNSSRNEPSQEPTQTYVSCRSRTREPSCVRTVCQRMRSKSCRVGRSSMSSELCQRRRSRRVKMVITNSAEETDFRSPNITKGKHIYMLRSLLTKLVL